MAATDTLCVVLVRTSGPVNLGMIARACGNAGVTDLRLVTPLCEIDCDDCRKFSNHNWDFLKNAPIYHSLREAIADCTLTIATSARPRGADAGKGIGLPDIPELLGNQGRTAVVFGNESHGLNRDELELCRHWLHIETPGPYPSYNLSHAVAITLHALATTNTHANANNIPTLAEDATVQALIDDWTQTLVQFNYFRRTSLEHFTPRFRSFIRRMPFTTKDCEVLRGMLAQFRYIEEHKGE